MKAIFTEKDFKLCRVPVPKGYPQSQTHVGIAVAGGKLYLTTSPFPAIRYGLIHRVLNKIGRKLTKGLYPPIYGDAQENPMLYWGGDAESLPTVFTPYVGNPIASPPPQLFGLHSYNSDPDIFTEGDDIYILNRECFRKSSGNDYWCRITQFHFFASEKGAEYVGAKILLETPTLFLSPSVVKWKSEYCMFNLETTSYNTGEKECHIIVRRAEKVDGQYGKEKELMIQSESFVPWHFSVFEHEGELYSIVACIEAGTPKRLYQMLGKFDEDLTTLLIYQRPLVSIPSYRGAAHVDVKGNMVLYSTTDRYRVTGSTSVDGKDVIMMSKNFGEVLSEIQNKE